MFTEYIIEKYTAYNNKNTIITTVFLFSYFTSSIFYILRSIFHSIRIHNNISSYVISLTKYKYRSEKLAGNT